MRRCLLWGWLLWGERLPARLGGVGLRWLLGLLRRALPWVPVRALSGVSGLLMGLLDAVAVRLTMRTGVAGDHVGDADPAVGLHGPASSAGRLPGLCCAVVLRGRGVVAAGAGA